MRTTTRSFDGDYPATTDSFGTLAEHSPNIIVRFDHRCRTLYANNAFSEFAGIAKDELLGKFVWALNFKSNGNVFHYALTAVIASGQSRIVLCNWKAADGREMASECRLIPEFDSHGAVVAVLGVGQHASEIDSQERWLNHAEAIAHIGHWRWDTVCEEVQLSAEACRILEHEAHWKPNLDEVLSKVVAADRARFLDAFRGSLSRKEPELTLSCCVESRSSIIHLRIGARFQYRPDGKLFQLIGTVQDISELRQYEFRLHQLAFYDALTGLPNRALFHDRLSQSLADAERHSRALGLLIIGPSGLRNINDIHGHETGDRLLKALAERLSSMVGSYDTLARLEGDEFAILLPEVREAASLGVFSQRIQEALAVPFQIETEEFYISACIGIAVYPLDGTTASEMLQYADSALHDARAHGRSKCRFYSSDLTASSRRRAALEAALRLAERNGELELHYQPKIDLVDGRIVGAEALLRWNHPVLGSILPGEFIGIAENAGLISSIGTWVLTKACLDAHRWNQRQGQAFKVAVNLSSLQFDNADFVESVFSILSLADCEPHWLEFEITESLLLNDNSDVRATLDAFKNLGITIAVDDFGTGYSSLAYLKRFPIDVLKIDRSFISDLAVDRDSTELVKAIITMAHSLRLGLVAEGVESKEQEQFLLASGCRLGQGYLFSKPLTKSELEASYLLAVP